MTIKRFITNLLALFTLFTVSLACKDTEKSIINSSFSISEEYLIQNLINQVRLSRFQLTHLWS